MKAAVVHSFDSLPAYGDFELPAPAGNEVRVKMHAAGLSNLVRAQASGKHYSATAHLPFVPGVDGVGVLEDGRRVFVAFPRVPYGTMAEHTVIARDLCADIPDDIDDVTAAAAGNPAMSSWAGLTERARFVAGESVLVNGATGTAGRLAIQIARHLDAKRIVVTGRNAASRNVLLALGADEFIALDQSPEALVQAFQDEIVRGHVRVVLDYLWGASAEHLIAAIAGVGSRIAGDRVRFVQIGAVSGPTITLPAVALRSAGLELMGTGLGSVSNPRLVQSIGELMRVFRSAKMTIDTETVPLTDVATAWERKTARRLVFTMP
jgi:NADPH:quinone reductase-like Zn-dependent oxidoreductase